MKIGKGASSVLTMPLHSVVLLTVGFLFGFLSALSFNQQVCDTQSVYTPQTGHVVIETQSKVSNVLLEDQTSLASNEREKDTHMVEVVPAPSNYCPPCEQFKKISQIISTLAKQNESIHRDVRQKKSLKGQRLGKLGAAHSAYEKCEMRNASGWLCRNPTLVDRLPQTYIHRTSDYYFHRLVGTPFMDVQQAPKNLLAMAVGIKQNASVNAIIEKFPKEQFQIVLFHYDNAVEQWDQFEWNDRVIHIQSTGQSKWYNHFLPYGLNIGNVELLKVTIRNLDQTDMNYMLECSIGNKGKVHAGVGRIFLFCPTPFRWFAKRFLHPDVVAPYEYIFVWDEDLGVENFDPIEYIEIMKRNGLQISQPAVDGDKSWPITVRQFWTGKEVHKRTPWEGLGDNCTKSNFTPPCAGFVEIQAPVFVSKVWRCVWHLIQNDLVMAWGLDFQLQSCIDGAPHEHIGIVDTQWVVHNKIPSLGSEGAEADNPEKKRGEVIARSFLEWSENKKRWAAGIESQTTTMTSFG